MHDPPFVGNVHVKFTNIWDAERAKKAINSRIDAWEAQYAPSTSFKINESSGKPSGPSSSVYEGQILVLIIFTYPPEDQEIDLAGETIYKVAIKYGTVMAFEVRRIKDREIRCRLEFCDSRASAKALENLNNLVSEVSSLLPTGYSQKANFTKTYTLVANAYDQVCDIQEQPSLTSQSSIIATQDPGLDKAFDDMTLNRQNIDMPYTPGTSSCLSWQYPSSSANSPFPNGCHTSPTFDSYIRQPLGQYHNWSPESHPYAPMSLQPPPWSRLGPGTIGQERAVPVHERQRGGRDLYSHQNHRPGSMVVRHCHEISSGNHNVVDITRISLGTDVRTTVSSPNPCKSSSRLTRRLRLCFATFRTRSTRYVG